jgi:hypothetical protein
MRQAHPPHYHKFNCWYRDMHPDHGVGLFEGASGHPYPIGLASLITSPPGKVRMLLPCVACAFILRWPGCNCGILFFIYKGKKVLFFSLVIFFICCSLFDFKREFKLFIIMIKTLLWVLACGVRTSMIP